MDWRQVDDSRDTQELWTDPDVDGQVRRDLIGLCPYRGRLLLDRQQAKELAVALLNFADEAPEPPLRLVK